MSEPWYIREVHSIVQIFFSIVTYSHTLALAKSL